MVDIYDKLGRFMINILGTYFRPNGKNILGHMVKIWPSGFLFIRPAGFGRMCIFWHFYKNIILALSFRRSGPARTKLMHASPVILGPYSQCSFQKIPKFLKKFRFQNSTLKSYFLLIISFHVCYFSYGEFGDIYAPIC